LQTNPAVDDVLLELRLLFRMGTVEVRCWRWPLSTQCWHTHIFFLCL